MEMVRIQFYGDSGPYRAGIYEVEAGDERPTDGFGDSITNVVPRELYERYLAARDALADLEGELETYGKGK